MARKLLSAPILWLVACGSPQPLPAAPVPVVALDASSPALPPAPTELGDTAEPTSLGEAVAEAVAPEPTLPEPIEASTWTVRRGETLAHFARWSELPVEAIADASALPLEAPLAVGDEVRVPGDAERRARVEVARDAHHRRRAQGYLASRGGARGTDFYRVRTGDTAWTVARDEIGVPVWLLEVYNPTVDLDALRPGQRLMVPVIDDSVADAAEAPTRGTSEAP